MIQQETKISISESNGVEKHVPYEYLSVENVFNKSKMVRLVFNNISIVVHSKELLKAIDNAIDNEIL